MKIQLNNPKIISMSGMKEELLADGVFAKQEETKEIEKKKVETFWKSRIHTALTIILSLFSLLVVLTVAYNYTNPQWKTTELVAKIIAPAGDRLQETPGCTDPCFKYTSSYPTISGSLNTWKNRPCPRISKRAKQHAISAALLFKLNPDDMAFSCAEDKPFWSSQKTTIINSHIMMHALEDPKDEFAYVPFIVLPMMITQGMSTSKAIETILLKHLGSNREIPYQFKMRQILLAACVQQVCSLHANSSAVANLAALKSC